MWRNRWLTEQQELDKVAGKTKLLFTAICFVLADSSRPGSPCTFTAEQVCQIIAVACETPPAPLTHWTRNDLVRVVIARGIVATISASTIGRILKEGDLKPHRSRYWLNHTVEDEAQFRQEVRTVCKLYHQAHELHAQGVHLVSTDEKTGIQALEPIHPTHPMIAGRPEQKEFEYERHGTQMLIANFEVARVESFHQRSVTRILKKILPIIFVQLLPPLQTNAGFLLPINSIRTNPKPWLK